MKISAFVLMTLLLVSFVTEVAQPFVHGERRLEPGQVKIRKIGDSDWSTLSEGSYISDHANFTYIPLVPYANDTVTFDASTSMSDDGSIISYEWSLGDNTNGTGIIVNKVYEAAGDYIVTLTVTSDEGAKDTTSKSITIIPRPEGSVIDLCNQKGGQGSNEPSGDFAPRDIVELTALLTCYEDPVEYKLVGFEVRNALGEVVLCRVNMTDANGLATTKFTISGVCLLGIFGTWTALAIADVAEQTVSDTLTFKVRGPLLDVYTQKPEPYSGKGFDQPSDAFAPQEEVILYGEVHYSCEPVEYKLVAFEIIDPHGTLIDVRTAMTDEKGIATTTFRIPSEPAFGEWTVHAIVDVAEKTVNDTVTFKVGWILEITQVRTVDDYGNPKTIFAKDEHICFNVTAQNIAFTSEKVTITIVVYDECKVPIGQVILQNWVTRPGQTEIFIIDSGIPEWAYVGMGTVYANAYTGILQEGGIPYCPETSTTFLIKAS